MLGLTHENFSAMSICRAAIEGVLSGLAFAVEQLKSQGISTERIIMLGGASRSEAVQQIAAEIFEHDIEVLAPAEYVADGAARQAAWALRGSELPPAWPLQGSKVVPFSGVASQARADYLEHLRSM